MSDKYCMNCMRPIYGRICPHCGTDSAAENPPEQIPVGTVIGSRFLVGLLRQRLWDGAVYSGRDQQTGETVCIRAWLPQGSRWAGGAVTAADPYAFRSGLEAFRSRTQAITQVEPLARLFAARRVVEDLGTAFLVTEAVQGTGLGQYLSLRGGALTEQETFRLLQPVLQAVATLHRAGFAHGNITLDTLLLDPMGGARLTDTGGVPGADPRWDAYALCGILKTCLGSSGMAALPAHRAAALEAGLSSDPARRYPNVMALTAALEAPAPQPEPAFRTESIYGTPGFTIPEKPADPVPQKKKKTLPLVLGALVLVAALAVVFFTVHFWQDATCLKPEHCSLCGKARGVALPHAYAPATCEEPETCRNCGGTRASALGHSWQEATCQAPRTCTRCGHTEGVPSGHGWQDATCTKPSTCATCGATQGSALGHDWKEATYEAPKTCRRCGATEGSIRGYYAEAPSHSIRFHTNTVSGWAQEFDSYYTDVYRFTIHVEITDVSYGSAEGRWEAFYRTSGGAWVSLGYFELTGDEASVTFTLEDPTDVTAVAAVIAKGGNFSFSKLCYVTDLYCYD